MGILREAHVRVQGMGELHLDIIVDRLRREYKVECDVGAPQVTRGGCNLHPVPVGCGCIHDDCHNGSSTPSRVQAPQGSGRRTLYNTLLELPHFTTWTMQKVLFT